MRAEESLFLLHKPISSEQASLLSTELGANWGLFGKKKLLMEQVEEPASSGLEVGQNSQGGCGGTGGIRGPLLHTRMDGKDVARDHASILPAFIRVCTNSNYLLMMSVERRLSSFLHTSIC